MAHRRLGLEKRPEASDSPLFLSQVSFCYNVPMSEPADRFKDSAQMAAYLVRSRDTLVLRGNIEPLIHDGQD